jgi:hypothetical protein
MPHAPCTQRKPDLLLPSLEAVPHLSCGSQWALRPSCGQQRALTVAAAANVCAAAAALQGRAPLIANPLYRQAVIDTAAALRCDWCRFLSSYCGGQQQQRPLLVKAVMGHFVERLRVQAVRNMVSRAAVGALLGSRKCVGTQGVCLCAGSRVPKLSLQQAMMRQVAWCLSGCYQLLKQQLLSV